MESKKINAYLSLSSDGELKIDPEILDNLLNQIGKLTKCENLDLMYHKIKSLSRSRFRIANSYYTDVFSVPKCAVKQWARSLSLVSVPGLYSDLDLEKGRYEGGYKVWESTADLVKYITEDESDLGTLLHIDRRFRALELGTGAGLPTLSLIGRILQDPQLQSNYSIHVQDYNWEVLASLTLINFAVNLNIDYLKALISTRCLRCFYGDWKDFRRRTNYKYNFIYMSEVIYNADNYESLHNLLDCHLDVNGIVVIATKNTYFGLTGGLFAWVDFLKEKKAFVVHKQMKVKLTNIPRSILVIKRARS